MGLYLMAAGWLDPDFWIAVLKVAIGLGMVIFVHELGHFAVAKLCGVKCEKFYLGFDIAGLKLCKFTWGETEYGIGILPLGGYVKMLGQEDNPARLRQEVERARQKPTPEKAPQANPEASPDPTTQTEPASGPDQKIPEADQPGDQAAQRALFDPRSYLAQSVPKRMAIISAGVIMNLVFAFLTATIAFGLGVRQISCGVGQVMPGEAAWQAHLKVGDRIVKIADQEVHKFRDLQAEISLGDDLEKGVPIVVRRPGEEGLRTFNVMPDSSGLLPRIGIANPWTTTLSKEDFVAWPGSAADLARPGFRPGDEIVSIQGEPIENYAELHAYLGLHPDEALTVTVRRAAGTQDRQSGPDDPSADPQRGDAGSSPARLLTVKVPANPMRRLGLVMEMGAITAVQTKSPAALAGIRPGDRITAIDGRAPGDAMTLPQRLRRRTGQRITLTIERPGAKQPLQVPVMLRRADWYEIPMAEGNPMTVPGLGIAYDVSSRVCSVLEDSPAAKAGLRAGDVVTEAEVIPPEQEPSSGAPFTQKAFTLPFDAEHRNWPSFIYLLQETLPGTTVELHIQRRDRQMTATLEPIRTSDWFNPDRGFIFEPVYFYQTAASLPQAVRWGAEETLNSTLLVYRFLEKLGAQQVSPRALGGPIAIFTVAQRAAEQGTSDLLIFLTLLSANLAVINFLPIPLLDGGHMLLLVWEGIRGKPADERVQTVLTYLGLIFILTLMAWVIGLDIGLISRR